VTTTLARPAIEAGACVHFESIAWCAICTGTDRKGIDPFVGMGLAVDVLSHTVRPAPIGGRCPSCGGGFPPGVLNGYAPSLGIWVPLCCGVRVDESDAVAASYFANLRTGIKPLDRMPDLEDDHRDDR